MHRLEKIIQKQEHELMSAIERARSHTNLRGKEILRAKFPAQCDMNDQTAVPCKLSLS